MPNRNALFVSNIEITFVGIVAILTSVFSSQIDNTNSSRSYPALREDAGRSDYMYQLPPIIHFNNPKMLPNSQSFMSSDDLSNLDTTQDDTDPLKLGGLQIREEARSFATKLRALSNDEIGVTTMQGIYNSYTYIDDPPDYDAKLDELWKQLRTKLDQFLQILRTTKITVDNLYTSHLRQSVDTRYECCNIPNGDLKYNTRPLCY